MTRSASLDPKCGECGALMRLRDSRFGKFWGCINFPACRGTHGAHPNGRPMGKPANKTTKEARIKTHEIFDQLWKKYGMSRSQAYAWLVSVTGIRHIGEATEAECESVMAAVCAKLAIMQLSGIRVTEGS
jgi:ssDNA-binding Zn-finger/Zn-ribbon topoisomerase 1